MKHWVYFVGVLAVLAACTSLPYKDDIGFLVSAQADSPEFPVYINGHLCTDMEGNQGLCAKRIKSTEDVTFKFDSMVYSYLLTINCTQGVTPIPGATVPQGQSYSFTLKASDFSQFISFTCIGEVSPQDRSPPISAKFKVSFTVVDARYTQREGMYITKQGGKNYLVLGEFARSARVKDSNGWHSFRQTTNIPVYGDPEKVKAYSESYAMRFNYFHMGDSDGGVND